MTYYRCLNKKSNVMSVPAVFSYKMTKLRGNHLYTFNSENGTSIAELGNEIRAAWIENPCIKFKEYTADNILLGFQPEDVTLYCGLYENNSLFEWLIENILEPKKIGAVTFKTGAIVLVGYDHLIEYKGEIDDNFELNKK